MTYPASDNALRIGAYKQVCIQLPASADNVTCSHLLLSARCAAIDQHLLPTGPTAANPPQRRAAAERWEGRTDRQTDARQFHIDPAPHIGEQCQLDGTQ